MGFRAFGLGNHHDLFGALMFNRKPNCACGKHHISWWTRTWPKIPLIGKPLACWITARRVAKFEQEIVDDMVERLTKEIDQEIIERLSKGIEIWKEKPNK